MRAACRPRAASRVVGNSATETRSRTASVTFSSVVSSWLVSGMSYCWASATIWRMLVSA
ncbi:MAG: hypothetical protein JWN71_3873 [Xanthobacteraceae bacterium]|nr:hypothetical protein [Xanthobacteraceae bacterium]